MKSRLTKTLVSTLIFLTLLAGIFAVFRPMYSAVGKSLRSFEEKYLNLLTETTGLTLSYKSLSPSVLTGIRIRDIVVADSESGEEVLSVKKAVIGYRLSKLLVLDWQHTFTKLTISDVSFTYGSEKYKLLMERLSPLVKNEGEENESLQKAKSADSKTENKGDEKFLSTELVDLLGQILFSLPFDMNVRNISAIYSDENFSARAVVRSLALRKSGDQMRLSGGLAGYVLVELEALNGQSLGFTYSIDGTLRKMISGSTFIASLDSYNRADYTLNDVKCMLRYEDDVLSLKSIQQLLPYTLSASFDNVSSEFTASVEMKKFDPLRLVSIPPLEGFLEQLVGSTLSCNADFSYNLRSGDYKWNADADVDLSRRFVPKGERVSLVANGNNREINVKHLEADGDLAGGEFYGSYNIARNMPQGFLGLEHFTLPNGGRVSLDLYVEEADNGFICFIPQLTLGEQVLQALQVSVVPTKNSIDFTFDMTDYSHSDFDVPGSIQLDGSYNLGDNQYLQATVSVDNLFLDTVLKALSFIVDTEENKTIGNLIPTFETFVSSVELYVSTDFSSLTYNSPFAVIANTAQDRQMLLLSFDGSERSIQVTQLDVLYGKDSLRAKVDADYSPEDKQIIFSLDFALNSIPYQLRGMYTLGDWLSVTGDFGLDVTVDFSQGMMGSAQMISFPIEYSGLLFSLNLASHFTFNSLSDFNVDVETLSVDELSGAIPFMPKLALQANVNPQGVIFSSLTYGDSYSSLSGSGYMLWNMNENIVDSATLDLALKNPLNEESVTVRGDVTNPLKVDLSGDHITKDFFFSLESEIKSFGVGRFISGQMPSDTLNASVTASGTLENPYVAVNVDSFTMEMGGAPLVAKGNAAILENTITVPNIEGSWNGFTLEGLSGEVALSSFSGSAGGAIKGSLMDKSLEVPFNLQMTNLSGTSEKNAFPESFSLELSSPGLTGSLMGEHSGLPLRISLIRSPGRFDIMTDDVLGAYGELLDDNSIHFSVNKSKPLHFDVDGNISMADFNISVEDLFFDLSKFAFLINTDYFSVYKGIITGDAHLTGLGTDPSIDGMITLSDANFNLPTFVPEHISTKEVIVELMQNEIHVPDSKFAIADTGFTAGATVQLDRWNLSSVDVSIRTKDKKGIPVDVKIPFVRIKGRATADMNLSLVDNALYLEGSASAQNTDITIMENFRDLIANGGEDSSSAKKEENNNSQPIDISIDLDVNVGQKVQVALNPLLRAMIAPDTNIGFTFDSLADTWSLKGDVVLRGGEVSYLSRNFYLREGRLILNEHQSKFDPQVTLRAETREHDANGSPVTIVLSAIRQNVSHFSPSFYSTPAKSENELMAIMGQILTGDSSNVGDAISAVGDFAVNGFVWRKLEAALRDLGNFDIFSIRTAVVQNASKRLFNMDVNSNNGTFLTSLFDNTTVYIGKYFASTIYVDALMHWTYNDSGSGGDIVFQPEIGFELTAPFATIRLNSVFDLDFGQAGDRTFIPDTSITLSWRFTF